MKRMSEKVREVESERHGREGLVLHREEEREREERRESETQEREGGRE